jgi:hypothetical protein
MKLKKECLKLYCLDLKHPVSPVVPRLSVTIEACKSHPVLWNRSHDTISQRLKHGGSVFVAHHNSSIVSFLFAAVKECWVSEIDDTLVINPAEIYLYDAFTAVEFRGNRIYPALMAHVAQLYKNRSFSHALIFTKINNTASVKAIEATGFSCFGVINYKNICGWSTWDYCKLNGSVKSYFQNEN